MRNAWKVLVTGGIAVALAVGGGIGMANAAPMQIQPTQLGDPEPLDSFGEPLDTFEEPLDTFEEPMDPFEESLEPILDPEERQERQEQQEPTELLDLF